MIRRRLMLSSAVLGLTGCMALSPSSEPPTIVFFESDSAALTGTALELVRAAAASAARYPEAPVRVLGFAEPEGSVRFSQALSRARAEHVADLLRQAGVSAGRIRVSARGPAPADQVEQESRRVEIRLGA